MRKVLKRVGIALGVLLVALVIAGAGFAMNGRSRLSAKYETKHALAAAPSDVARGEHVMRTRGCVDCHGDNLEGKLMMDMPLGRFSAPNLTSGRGGVGSQYRTVADWDRAVRHGVRPNGEWIAPFMPYTLYHNLSDADAAALATYLASLKPIDNTPPSRLLRVPGYVAMGVPGDGPPKYFAMIEGAHLAEPARGTTPAYGKYLASSTCVECHGADLQGGKHPDPAGPRAPSLQPAGRWTRAELATLLREGRRPNGIEVSHWMPSKRVFRHFDDEEIGAIHAYLASLPAPAAIASR